jgi:NADPH-dependent curcumin reductase CurA
MTEPNHQIRLAARPSGLPKASDWELTTEPVPVPAKGELVVAVEYFAIDPAMRGWIASSPFGEPVAIGDVMEASALGRVAASEHSDNVGGEILDAVLTRLRRGARVVLSGGLSQYNSDQTRGPSNYLRLIQARASMTGFVTPDYAGRYPQARSELARWLREGRLISREQIIKGGVRAFPTAVLKLFAGDNVGKLIIAVAPTTTDPTEVPPNDTG